LILVQANTLAEQKTTNWAPSAPIGNLRQRAQLLANTRAFFAERRVLEIEAPLIASVSGTDPALDPISVSHAMGDGYLLTSPEFPLKRLLSAGSGAVYALGKAFRSGERGRKHNPEFTMLEWYQPGYSLDQLIDEVAELFAVLIDMPTPKKLSYQQLFEDHLQLDPHSADVDVLQACLRGYIEFDKAIVDRIELLDMLFGIAIEPKLHDPVVIYDYPAEQAALAQVMPNAQGVRVAKRFELVYKTMELANGYFELTDPDEQQRRFEADNRQRNKLGLREMPIDHYLLAAMRQGMPSSSGVAVGFDRIVMIALNADSIDDVIAFTTDRI